jgi:hypothetical protein
MVDLIAQCQLACDGLDDITGRAAIQPVLQLSAMQTAGGPPQQDNRHSGEGVLCGHQGGQVFLSDRKLEVNLPRLRTKDTSSQEGEGEGEGEAPAYAAMQNPAPMDKRMLDILMRGVSAGRL